jgi:hypothetical protein
VRQFEFETPGLNSMRKNVCFFERKAVVRIDHD